MKRIPIFLILCALAGLIAVCFYLVNKKEVKTVVRNYAADLPNHMGKKKTVEDIYFPLDLPTHKISNTEIANFIQASLPLNPWLENPDSIDQGDTITWNCKAKGFGFDFANNPRVGVTYGHTMWLIARELLEFMYGVSGPIEAKTVKDSASIVPDPESPDLTKKELMDQKTLDLLNEIKNNSEEIIPLCYILIIGMVLILILGARIAYLIEHSD